MKNVYSRTWFELFLETRPYTEQETAFVIRNLPNPPYRKILDVCCGQGRHTNQLAKQGYEMVGLDLDEAALSIAQREAAGSVMYIRQDMRQLDKIAGTFDAVISLWQSFGYFDEATNEEILRQMSQKLNEKGRLILDIYNRAYWENNQGIAQLERKGIRIQVSNTMQDNRLTSRLEYGAGRGSERFEWQLYSLEEIKEMAARYRMKYVKGGVESDENKAVSAEKAQMQLVFEKER